MPLFPIALDPILTPRPWGGDNLRRLFGKPLPADKGPIGESWELSDHPDGRSTIAGSSKTFGALLRENPQAMIGRATAPAKYPLLVKYLDAQGDLSVQVHPSDAWCAAKGHDDRGKSECWYVIAAPPGTRVVYGFKAGVTEADARAALAAGRLTDLLAIREIHAGDFLTIPPGCVHAMCAGTIACEIQQSSNTTFRLYDWDRKPARALHIDDSMDVTTWDSRALPNVQQVPPLPASGTRNYQLVENEFFEVRAVDLAPGTSVSSAELRHETGAILNVVVGEGTVTGSDAELSAAPGRTFFLPADLAAFRLTAGAEGLRVLRTISREIA